MVDQDSTKYLTTYQQDPETDPEDVRILVCLPLDYHKTPVELHGYTKKLSVMIALWLVRCQDRRMLPYQCCYQQLQAAVTLLQ